MAALIRQSCYVAGVAVVVVTAAGCATLSYYGHTITGQLEILGQRESIQAVMEDPDTATATRQRLDKVLEIREFASTQLGLPDNDSYRVVVDLDRDYAMWNVLAAPEFDLALKTWCFPVAGCVPYRGYFDIARARGERDRLALAGYDVYVGGVPAYSTLGWFTDPVFTPTLAWPEQRLARLIFHELAHQKVYVRGDAEFNEAFAVFVELEGARRWYAARDDDAALRTLAAERERQAVFAEVVEAGRDRLRELYDSDLDPDAMRSAKAAVFESLKVEYEQRLDVPDDDPYGGWLEGEPNNARLGAIVTYQRLVPAFENLLARHDGDLEAFYAAVHDLAGLSRARRHEALVALKRDPTE